MRRQALIQVVGAMISGAFTIASGSMDAWEVTQASVVGFPWQWGAVGGFVFFCFFVGWGWYSEYRRAQKLEELQPSVEVEPHHEGRKAWFTVKNIGQHAATFEVHIHLTGTTKGQLTFNGKWREAKDSRSISLKADAKADMNLVETHGRKDGIEVLNILTAQATVGAEVLLGGSIQCTLTVVSEPKLRHPFVREYTLRLGEDGNWYDVRCREN